MARFEVVVGLGGVLQLAGAVDVWLDPARFKQSKHGIDVAGGAVDRAKDGVPFKKYSWPSGGAVVLMNEATQAIVSDNMAGCPDSSMGRFLWYQLPKALVRPSSLVVIDDSRRT